LLVVFSLLLGEFSLLVLVFRVIRRVLIRLLGRRRWLALSRLDVQLSPLEISLVELGESLNGGLLRDIAHEADTKRHSFAVLAEWDLDINYFTVLAKELLDFFFGNLIG